MGFVKVSEGILNGKVHTGTYSMPTNTTLSKRNTTFSKRGGKNYEGAFCASSCAPKKSIPAVNPDHCKEVYNELYSRAVQFSVNSRTLPSLPQDYNTKLTDARLGFDTQRN